MLTLEEEKKGLIKTKWEGNQIIDENKLIKLILLNGCKLTIVPFCEISLMVKLALESAQLQKKVDSSKVCAMTPQEAVAEWWLSSN